MNTDTLILFALGAVLVFWAVGAHNRLVRLKNAVGREYAAIDAHLVQRQKLLGQLQAVGDRLDDGALSQLETASRAARFAMDLARQRPSGGPEALALERSAQGLDLALASVWESTTTQAAVGTDPALRQVVVQLVELDHRFELLAQPYHQAVQAYNEAVREFPAWLIAQLAGLKPLPGLQLERHAAARAAARPMLNGRREEDVAVARVAGL
jgi:LemA protein